MTGNPSLENESHGQGRVAGTRPRLRSSSHPHPTAATHCILITYEFFTNYGVEEINTFRDGLKARVWFVCCRLVNVTVISFWKLIGQFD